MKRIFCALAFACCLVLGSMTASAFDYDQSVDEISLSPTTAYDTVYLGMSRADFDANFSALPGWTFYGNTTSRLERAERSVTRDGVTVQEGLVILTDDTAADSKVLAFDNYFRTADKKTARDIYRRLRASIYAAMDDFPVRQSSRMTTWVRGDVTIVVFAKAEKDKDGMYAVVIRRYNNHVLKE